MQQRTPTTAEAELLARLPAFPTMYDLPSEDPEEPGLRDEFHGLQPQLLSLTLQLSGYSSGEIFTAFDLNLYYDLAHPLWHKRPDWFLVVGVPRLYEGRSSRNSYVLWQEKVTPTIIVEFLSPGTEDDDLGRFFMKPGKKGWTKPKRSTPPLKFEVYEEILKVPHYVVFNQETHHLRHFRLTAGRYEEQTVLSDNPRIWIPELEIGLALWQGEFRGIPETWLRWCNADGALISTDAEAAQQAAEAARQQAVAAQQQRDLAEAQRQQAEAQRQQAEEQIRQTVRNLLSVGMSVAQITQVTGVSATEVEAIAQASQHQDSQS